MKVDVDKRDFRRILNDPGVTAAVLAETEKAAMAARGLAPVDSGEYVGSIEVSTETGGVRHDRKIGVVTASSDHAAAIEFGNSKTRAQHVLQRAGEAIT